MYGNGSKSEIDDARLFQQTIKQSKKVTLSVCVTWNGATKPFFVNDKDIKMNSKLYKKHLEKELIPDIERIMNKNDWIFVQDSAPSHCSNLVQDNLSETLNK